MAWLRDRANSLSASSNDNMLSISSDGRKAALDPRLVLAPDPDNAGGKLSAAAANIARIARDNPGSVPDRKRVGEGRRVSVRVDLGGRPIINTKTNTTINI